MANTPSSNGSKHCVPLLSMHPVGIPAFQGPFGDPIPGSKCCGIERGGNGPSSQHLKATQVSFHPAVYHPPPPASASPELSWDQFHPCSPAAPPHCRHTTARSRCWAGPSGPCPVFPSLSCRPRSPMDACCHSTHSPVYIRPLHVEFLC